MPPVCQVARMDCPPGVGRRTWWRLVLLCALAAAWPGTPRATAQVRNDGVVYSRQLSFSIPFDLEAGDKRYQEVQLFVSEDRGLSWQKVASVFPGQHSFPFDARHDGLYWFTPRTIDSQGRASPATVQGVPTELLKIVIDTQPPVITLRPRPPRDGLVGVEWEIREDNLDPLGMALEYRLPGNGEWSPVNITPGPTGERFWAPGTNGPSEVRLRVRDLAKNEAEAKLTLTPGSQDYRGVTTTGADPGTGSGRDVSRPVSRRYVNSKRISLNYEVTEKGPSGISAVELWCTRDGGRNWDKYNEDTTPNPQPPYVYEVAEEGLYGFTLVFRSGVNEADPPPRSGDAPQVWVQVDTTKPKIDFLNVDQGPDRGTLLITWKASDPNLGNEPVTLSYAKDPQAGQWVPLKTSLPNNGRYLWRLPPDVPYMFTVRIEVTDLANNVAQKDHEKPTKVDLVRPKGKILDVAPAGHK